MTRSAETATEVPCNLCGENDAEVIYEANHAQASRVVRCRHCQLMYASPRAVVSDVEDISTWEADGALDWEGDHPALFWNRQRRIKESLQVVDYAETRADLARRCPERGHLVEVGAGLGYLSAYFTQDGWTVTSIEPWAEACQHAERLGVSRAIPSTLEEAKLPDASVDVLVMLHVIEHVPDPRATLAEIHRVVKPGGLVVLETPRVDGTAAKLFGHRDRNIRCDGHIYFFGAPQMAQLCEEEGFGVARHDMVGRSLTLGRVGYNVSQIVGSKRAGIAFEKVNQALSLDKLRFKLNIRDMQRLLLVRRPSAALPRPVAEEQPPLALLRSA